METSQNKWKHVKTCQNVSKQVKTCQNMSKHVNQSISTTNILNIVHSPLFTASSNSMTISFNRMFRIARSMLWTCRGRKEQGTGNREKPEGVKDWAVSPVKDLRRTCKGPVKDVTYKGPSVKNHVALFRGHGGCVGVGVFAAQGQTSAKQIAQLWVETRCIRWC